MEEVVSLKNGNGRDLVGVLHLPEQSAGSRKIGIHLLNPGIKYRVAPNRLNVTLARALCREGFPVLRVDPEGIGDSEGELEEGILVGEVFEAIQKGMFVSDALTCNDWMVNEYGMEQIIMMGNCGGAITSLLACEKDERITGMCLIDVPIVLRTPSMSLADRIVEGGKRSDVMFQAYLRKVFSAAAWYRFFSFKSDYSGLWKIITTQMRKRGLLPSAAVALPSSVEELCAEGKLNKKFFLALESALSRAVELLFVCAENDAGTDYLKKYWKDGFFLTGKARRNFETLVEFLQVDGANHVYSLPEWQEVLINRVCSWAHERVKKVDGKS